MKTKSIIIILLFLLSLLSCSQDKDDKYKNIESIPPQYNEIEIKDFNKIYSLKKVWRFQFYSDNDLSPAEYSYDDSDWYNVQLPHSWTSKNGLIGYKDHLSGEKFTENKLKELRFKKNNMAWYRITIIMPDTLPKKTLGVKLGTIGNLDRVYFNGVMIGKNGDVFSSKKQFAYDKVRLYEIPSSLIKQGKNVIVVLINGYFPDGQGSGMYKGDYNIGIFNNFYEKQTRDEYIKLCLIAIYFILGFYYIMIFLYQRSSSEFLFFALYSFCIGIYLFLRNQIKYVLFDVDNTFIMKKIEYIILFSLVPIWIHFLESLFRKKNISIVLILVDICSGVCILILLFVPHIFIWNYINTYFYLPLILCNLIYTLIFVIYYIFKKNREAILLILGIVVLIFAIVNDNLTHFGYINTPRILQWGFLVFILQIAFILANRFNLLYLKTIKSNKDLNMLYDSSMEMSSGSSLRSENIDELTYLIIKIACTFAKAETGSLMLLNDDKKSMIIRAIYGKKKKNVNIGKKININDNSPSGYVIKNKRPILASANKKLKSLKINKTSNEYSTGSFIVFPLVVKNEIYGCVNITEKENGQSFDDDDLALLTAFSSAASVAIENAILNQNLIVKERLEKEMELAKQIQTAILPKKYTNNTFDIAGCMLPAEEVGGDYFDYIVDQTGREWFCIGDVTSHGLTPGLIMMMAQSIVNTLINSKKITTDEVINSLNKILFDNINNRLQVSEYMTISVLCHLGDGKIDVSGKHEDILIYRKKSNTVEIFPTEGMWVGILPIIDNFTNKKHFNLQQDDVLLLYTDGVIEAMNKDDELFDMDRLTEILKSSGNKTSQEIIDIIIKHVNDFMFIQRDDITIMVVKRKE